MLSDIQVKTQKAALHLQDQRNLPPHEKLIEPSGSKLKRPLRSPAGNNYVVQ